MSKTARGDEYTTMSPSDYEWLPGQPNARICNCRQEGCLICLTESLMGPGEPETDAAFVDTYDREHVES